MLSSCRIDRRGKGTGLRLVRVLRVGQQINRLVVVFDDFTRHLPPLLWSLLQDSLNVLQGLHDRLHFGMRLVELATRFAPDHERPVADGTVPTVVGVVVDAALAKDVGAGQGGGVDEDLVAEGALEVCGELLEGFLNGGSGVHSTRFRGPAADLSSCWVGSLLAHERSGENVVHGGTSEAGVGGKF